jgi:hypothetical protein
MKRKIFGAGFDVTVRTARFFADRLVAIPSVFKVQLPPTEDTLTLNHYKFSLRNSFDFFVIGVFVLFHALVICKSHSRDFRRVPIKIYCKGIFNSIYPRP